MAVKTVNANTAMGASGVNHAPGDVPDPGATAGTTKFLREDATWSQPAFSGISGIASVAQGGTGTATPSLVAGSNVTITGSWPDQTISASGGGGSGGAALYFRKTLGANVSVLANTVTTIDTLTINAAGGSSPAFPAAGTWRVMVAYSYYSASGSGRTGETRVTDGLGNTIAASEGGSFGDAGTNYHGAGWTPVTYTGSSSVTFTVQVINTGSQTIDTNSVLLGNPGYIEIAVFSS